jgi:hypothetical protein
MTQFIVEYKDDIATGKELACGRNAEEMMAVWKSVWPKRKIINVKVYNNENNNVLR